MKKNKLIELYNILEEIGKVLFLPNNNIKFYCDLDIDLSRIQLFIENPKNNGAYVRYYINKDDLNNCINTDDIKMFAYESVLTCVLVVNREVVTNETG